MSTQSHENPLISMQGPKRRESSPLRTQVVVTSPLLSHNMDEGKPKSALSNRMRSVLIASEVLATIGIIIYAIAIQFAAPLMPISIIERDPTISYPFVPSTVPSSTLILFAVLIPSALFLICHTSSMVKHKARWNVWLVALCYSALALLQAIVFTLCVTDTIKTVTSFPRPNMYAYCNYMGLARDALSNRYGNYSAYFAATVPGRIGDQSLCAGDAHDVRDSQLSFPSGHSSIGFTAMTVAANFLRHSFGVPRGVHHTVPALISASPLVLSAWVAITRVRDRYHNTIDIVCGALIGAIIGYQAWRHHTAHGRHKVLPPLVVVVAGGGAAGGHRSRKGGQEEGTEEEETTVLCNFALPTSGADV